MITKTTKCELVIAGAEDSDAMQALFEQTSYNHSVDIQFRRGENPYTSFVEEDAGAVVLLAKEIQSGKTIGMGACSFHEIYINGTVKRGGYLNGLKLLPGHSESLRQLVFGFQQINALTKDQVDLYYATILQQAESVQRNFEKKRKSMPVYEKQCVFTSFLFKPACGTLGLHLEKGRTDGLDDFYEERLCHYNFAPVSRKRNNLCDEDFITWRENGKILASCAIYNNQSKKNYLVKGYKGILRLLPYAPTKLIGLPSFPKPGSVINNATLSLLLFDESVDLSSRQRFIRAASSFAKEYACVTLGLTDTDDTYAAFHQIRHMKFSSYFYTIHYDAIQSTNNRPIYLDIAYM